MNEFKRDLISAHELKTVGKNRKALKLYEKCYKKHPEEFSFNQINDYAWTIYKTRIAFFKDEDELFENVEFITQLVEQRNFNKCGSCVYTSSIFKVFESSILICWMKSFTENMAGSTSPTGNYTMTGLQGHTTRIWNMKNALKCPKLPSIL